MIVQCQHRGRGKCKRLVAGAFLAFAVLSGLFIGPDFSLASPAYPEITFHDSSYFSVNGITSFIFVRNMAGYMPSQYERLLDLTKAGGTQLVRIQLDSMGMGYTRDGNIDEAWAQKWEQVFAHAAENGICILPVFSGWFDWNNGDPDYGYSMWKSNPFNAAIGGPARTPAELFKPDSLTQKFWLHWMKRLVERWQGRENIVAWEVFSEVNISTGATERLGVDFVRKAASVIRAADSRHRPVTASLAEVGEWPDFYRSNDIDFINFHPYPASGQLDTFIIKSVRQYLAKYHKPVFIGESGLSALPPNPGTSTLTTAENAQVGVEHATWAAMVSGAMNGRSLYWEDGFAVFFPSLNWPFIEKNADIELPASRFARGVNFAGFRPLAARSSGGITGAVLGHEKMVIGWFRDASCEPPNWTMKPAISRQIVTISVPGPASTWIVDFYNTRTGTEILGSISVTRKGDSVKFYLPTFTNDVAFKMYTRE